MTSPPAPPHPPPPPTPPPPPPLLKRLHDYFEPCRIFFHLGLHSFGGAPYHFSIAKKEFVFKRKWLDLRTFRELYAMTNALPAPASSQTIYCVSIIHYGLNVRGILLGFWSWILPGLVIISIIGIVMVKYVSEQQGEVALIGLIVMDGLTVAGIGLVASAVLQLALSNFYWHLETPDPRLDLCFICLVTCCLSVLLHQFQWSTPVVTVSGGLMELLYIVYCRYLQGYIRDCISKISTRKKKKKQQQQQQQQQDEEEDTTKELNLDGDSSAALMMHGGGASQDIQMQQLNIQEKKLEEGGEDTRVDEVVEIDVDDDDVCVDIIPPVGQTQILLPDDRDYLADAGVSNWLAVVCFLLWVTLMVVAFVLHNESSNDVVKLLTAFYLTGAILFGDGPVMIPLLLNYLVTPGYISPSLFLFGIAVSNVLPGPAFNFISYAAIVSISTLWKSQDTNVLALFLFGISCTVLTFLPGMLLITSIFPVWKILRRPRFKLFMSVLDGFATAAIGITFGSVFLLWNDALKISRIEYTVSFTILALVFILNCVYKLSALVLIPMAVVISLIYYGILMM
ncbi:hypothetical protein MP638_006245 [Amoeboaphelidium occidentale]|nr:hypothetical protein MP638_006245 [Amoeboaphelidium occidentale]